MKFFQSLLAKYMLIIFLALSLIQIAYLLVAIFVSGLAQNIDEPNMPTGSEGFNQIEENWHKEASNIQDFSVETISKHFAKWKRKYPSASMFWVDNTGKLTDQLDVREQLPSEWTASMTAKYIKERYGGDPFTVIAFVGKGEAHGFIVFEIPRKAMDTSQSKIYEKYGSILFISVIIIIFLFITASFLFFRSIRKRLINLQDAMTIRDIDGLPIQIDVKKKDEIGQLEQTFNGMVFELKESKQREQKEEQLRRELIANLSHDLRTPLTKIQAQSHSLKGENLSLEGSQAVKAIEVAIVNIDRLIENLMSYTLLTASKYKFEPKEIDVVRFMREFLASWYPVFEKEGFVIDVELHSFEKGKWTVDPIWLGRIVDNLFQNVLRHAKSGQYIGVQTVSTDQYDSIVISDRGKGMKYDSNEKGAEIGLTIVDLMVKGMKLNWDIESNENGTIIKIKRSK